MSSQVVKNTILQAFSHHSINSFILLSQDTNGKLTHAEIQEPDGDSFINAALKHRGNV